MSADISNSSPARRYGLIAVKLTVSVVLLAILFSRIDVARLWASVRRASVFWLLAAMVVYSLNVLASTWRWHLLLEAQDVHVRRRSLLDSFLVALFFNNFLPSNIGGDVIRIRRHRRPAGSKTLAATVVLVDRGLGLMGLVLVAAMRRDDRGKQPPRGHADLAVVAVGRVSRRRGGLGPGRARAGRLRRACCSR